MSTKDHLPIHASSSSSPCWYPIKSCDQHFSRQTHETKGIEKKKIMERINGWVWFNDSIKRDLRINGTLSNK
jgi:hypothetical protein